MSDLVDLSADDAKPAASPSAAASTSGFVDLSTANGSSVSKPAAAAASDDGILEVWGSDTPLHVPSSRQRKKRKPNPNAASMANVEAIDMTGDVSVASLKQTPEEKLLAEYKQTLGPLRMEFVSEQNADAFLKTHTYSTKNGSGTSMGQIKTRKWHRELVQYAINLPITPQGSVFVRVHESRLDLVRTMITGPEGTPYENGCFFFDFGMKDYPNSPPVGKLLTTGGGSVRFNPNLYNCGKICLSLLGTWQGPGWIPNKSTFLQVLVSIQGLILVPDPYFNEPGYEHTRGKPRGQSASNSYNTHIRLQTLKWAIEDPLLRSLDMLEEIETASTAGSSADKPSRKPRRGQSKKKAAPSTCSQQGYPEFALVVVMHFVQKAEAIEAQLKEWTKLDSGIKPQATKIRSLLQRALQQQQSLSTLSLQQKPTKAAASALKRPACAKKALPPGAEVIEIL
ncbi:MAG: hypothetical protein SGILL_002668 [Bacillariaceae sp.]